MIYQGGHDYFVRAIDSTAVISDTTGAITLAPAITAAADIGYTSPGAVTINDNAAAGFAAGSENSLYDKTGWREASLSADIRLGSVAFIKDKCLAVGALPYLDLFYGISAQWSRAIYRARCASLSLSFPMSEAAELTASARFEGIAYATATPITLAYAYQQFGPALLATDVRTLKIGTTDIRQNVMSLSLDIERNVERKNGRPEFGDNVPGSRTAYDIITHQRTVSGSLQLHDLPDVESTLFYGTATARKWSNIVITVNDLALGQIYDVTILNPRPVQRQQNQIESAAQMNWTVPFIASGVTIATTRVVVP